MRINALGHPMAAQNRHAGSRKPRVKSRNSGRAQSRSAAASKRKAETNALPAGAVEAIAAVKKTLQAAGFSAVEEYLLREFQATRYDSDLIDDTTARFRNYLDLVAQGIRDNPSLRAEFEAHSGFQVYTRAQDPGGNVMPDFPSERYKDRPTGEDILGFLRRVWLPYLYYGFANAEDIKAVDPDAFKAIPWPPVTYETSRQEFKNDVAAFMQRYWRELIEVGVATRQVIRDRDPALEEGILYRLGRGKKKHGVLPSNICPPTAKDLNTRALSAPYVPLRHQARLFGTQATRLRRRIS
jgi:hypothetical protein